MLIDAPRRTLKSLIFGLTCVDALPGLGLRLVILQVLSVLLSWKTRCVDLMLVTLSGYRLCGEIPTDWVKSD